MLPLDKIKINLGELKSIASKAKDCPSVKNSFSPDIMDEIIYAEELVIGIEDMIREHEIDCMLDKNKEDGS